VTSGGSPSEKSRAYRTAFRKRYGVGYGQARRLSRVLWGHARSPARAARFAASSARGVELTRGRGPLGEAAWQGIVFRGEVANALADVRAGIHTVREAEAAYGFAPGTLRAQFPSAFGRSGVVVPGDSELVVMEVLTGEGGVVFVVTTSQEERSLVGRHDAAIEHFLRTGQTTRLDDLEGQQLGEYTLETSPSVIEALDEAGGLPHGPYPQARGVA
jgi:hypothetical protein